MDLLKSLQCFSNALGHWFEFPYWVCCYTPLPRTTPSSLLLLVLSFSVAQLCLTLCNPVACSTPVFPVLHYLQEFAQTPVHWLRDAIQSSHPLPSPSAFFFKLSQHQGLLQWVGSLHQVAKVLELHLSISPPNEYSGLIFFRIDWFDLLAVQGTLKESPPALHFESISSLALSLLHSETFTSIHDYWKNHSFD